MARGWRYTKLSLSTSLLLYFSGMCFVLLYCFLFVVDMLSLELCRCSSDIFLFSRPRTGLATTYITGYA